jgi:hypothetical protein
MGDTPVMGLAPLHPRFVRSERGHPLVKVRSPHTPALLSYFTGYEDARVFVDV